MKFLLLLTIICCQALSSGAQSNDTTIVSDQSKVAEPKINFVTGLTYNSALNYYGRTDSLKSKGLYPFVGINFKNGLYINSSFVFINNQTAATYAATIAEAGYQFKNEKGNWAANVFANGFFYRKNIALVQSALKATAGINVANLNKIININLGSDLKLSSNLDYGVSVGIDHTIRIDKVGKGVIVFDPSAYLYAGTQSFTKTYYQEKKFLFLPAGEEQVTTNSKKFNILSYEFSVPVVYALGKMNIIVLPSYVLPQNLISVPGRPDLSENGNHLFYITTSLKFTL